MSDKYYLLSYYVKVCQTCLSRMSIVVILCQTCLSWVVAQDVETSIGGSGETLFIEDIAIPESPDAGNSLDTMSDIYGQAESSSVTDDDSNIAIDQSGTTISPDAESGMVSDVVSNAQSGTGGSGASDNTGELLISDLSQSPVGQGAVEQNVPQTAYSSVENEPQADISSFVLMTSFVLANPSPQISITEVRIDGTDEYIELTNRGDPFVGSVSISGVKTSGLLTVALDLGTNDSIVIGDTLAMAVASGFDILFNQSLSMTDTTARSLQLIYSGDVIDTLDLSATQVVGSDSQSASREYDFAQQLWQVTPLSHNVNITLGQFGNPGVVWGLTLFPSNTGSTSTGSAGTGIISTGVVLTGTNSTGITFTGFIQVSQVYPFSDCVGEHLALSFSTDYSGSLTIAGLGTSDTSKTFDIVAESGSLRYLVESMSGVLSDNVILVPNMTLTDGGESLVISDGSGLILDSIIYSSTQSNKISTFTSYSGDTRLFATNQSPSILSSCNQSAQLPQIGGCRISTVNEGYSTGSFSAGFTVSGSLVDSSCGSSSRLVDGVVSTSNSCSLGSSFAPGSHRIVYQQYSGSTLICEDEYMFYGMIQAQSIPQNNTIVSCSSNNSSSYYEALYRKWKLKHDELTTAVEYVGLTVTSNDDVYGTCDQALLSGNRLASMFDPAKPTSWTHTRLGQKLIISNILANGTGNDSDGTEIIELYNKSRDIMDIEGLIIVVNNKKVEILTGILGVNSYLTLTDYFPLPNGAGCVSVYSLEGEVYDEVCYGKYKNEQMIDLEYLKAPKPQNNKELTNITSNESDPKFIKSCLRLEEYQLLELDIKEQKLINRVQKENYQKAITRSIDYYRQRSDELYHTYRSITDSKQAYIDKQQIYITKLQGQVQKSYEYGARITQLYNNSKAYSQTISDRNRQCQIDQTYIQQNYPAIYRDPQLSVDMSSLPPPSILQQTTTHIQDNQTRRSTASETLSNLF